jgi:hypothetical protein
VLGKRAWPGGAILRGAKITNTICVIYFTKYEKDVVKTISFENFIDKFTSVKAGKVLK